MEDSALAMWADSCGDSIIIGDEDCKPGDPVFVIPLTQENVIEWIKALTTMLDDGTIISLPGKLGKCTNVE